MVKSICIYCASSDQIPQKYFQTARELGKLMGQRGMTLVNGAGNMGLMQASAEACIATGGKTIGIIPEFMIHEGWALQTMSKLIPTDNMHTRQELMMEMSDAAIILPGGFGTMAEFCELVTWKQLGLYLKPIIVLNTDGFYTPLLKYMQQAANENFLRQEHLDTFIMAQTPEEALRLAMETPHWNPNVRRFAKI